MVAHIGSGPHNLAALWERSFEVRGAVAMAAVVGRPDPVHGEEVVAFVSLRDCADVSGEQLVEWARDRIGGYEYPREVRIVESIPLTPVGKIDRKALRTRASDGLAAASRLYARGAVADFARD